MQLSKEEYARKRIHNGSSVQIENSVTRVTVRHHSASLVMPNSYPSDGIFNHHLTAIKDSYNPGPGPAGVTASSPRMVTECLLTRSMLIKNYLPFHGMCLYMYIVFTVSQFHADVHSVYLVFQIA